MKRGDLVKRIEGQGCVLIRHGAKHDWYRNPKTGVSQPVPRHREIKDHLARLSAGLLQKTAEGQILFPFDAVRVNFVLKAA